jgi:hypothetical protein
VLVTSGVAGRPPPRQDNVQGLARAVASASEGHVGVQCRVRHRVGPIDIHYLSSSSGSLPRS